MVHRVAPCRAVAHEALSCLQSVEELPLAPRTSKLHLLSVTVVLYSCLLLWQVQHQVTLVLSEAVQQEKVLMAAVEDPLPAFELTASVQQVEELVGVALRQRVAHRLVVVQVVFLNPLH